MFASGSQNNTIKLFNMCTHQEITTLLGHTKSVTSICFSLCGNILASSSCDKTIILWDTITYEELIILRGHTMSIESICFSPCDTEW